MRIRLQHSLQLRRGRPHLLSRRHDIFREPKPAAGFYKSQCDPSEEIVLEPAFHWALSDESIGFTKAVFCSNCDHLKIFVRKDSDEANPWMPLTELDPERMEFSHLTYPPFILDLKALTYDWGDLRIDGYINGKQVISKSLSGRGVDRKVHPAAGRQQPAGRWGDTTRVVLRVTDEFGALRTYADDPVVFTLEGPGKLIGENPFSLIGGTGAVWIRAEEKAGIVRLTAKHPRLGSQTVEFNLTAVPSESV